MLSNILDFLNSVWLGITLAMGLDPRALAIVESLPETGTVVLFIAILGGASQLLGQSVVLFLNRIQPARFILSLLINGLIYAASLMVWGLTIWIAGSILFTIDRPLGAVIRLAALGSAPFVFGFLILMPYAGSFIARLLYAWSLLIITAGVQFTYQSSFLAAALAVGIGWLLVMLLSSTLGKPIILLRNRVWRRITNTELDASAQDILSAFAAESSRDLEDAADNESGSKFKDRALRDD